MAVMGDYERYEVLLGQVEKLNENLRVRETKTARVEDHTARLAGLRLETWDNADTDAHVREEREARKDPHITCHYL